MERWLYLQNEPIENLQKLACGLEEIFEDSWIFLKDSNTNTIKDRIYNYSLDKYFSESVSSIRHARIIIGQKLFEDRQIRFGLKNDDTWANFIIPETSENYKITNELFNSIFECDIEHYGNQETERD